MYSNKTVQLDYQRKPNIDYLLWDLSHPTLIVGYMRDTWNGKQSDMVRGGYLDFVCPIEARLL